MAGAAEPAQPPRAVVRAQVAGWPSTPLGQVAIGTGRFLGLVRLRAEGLAERVDPERWRETRWPARSSVGDPAPWGGLDASGARGSLRRCWQAASRVVHPGMTDEQPVDDQSFLCPSRAALRAQFALLPSAMLMRVVVGMRELGEIVRVMADLEGCPPGQSTDRWVAELTVRADLGEDVLLERLEDALG